MSQEPSLGHLARSATAATSIQRGGTPLPARKENARQAAADRTPAGNQPAPRAVQNGVRAGEADIRNGTAAGDASRVRPSRDGGVPALQRELGAHGRETVRRLLEAGLAEFEEAGFQGARVEDIVRRAKTSHGTFYLYFANKDDLFRTLLRDALVDMADITDEFPVVTSNEAGQTALR